MTREDVKEILPILQAYAEGKQIQFQSIEGKWDDFTHLSFDCEPSRYRIKPEEEYRPYKDCEEMIDDYKVKHNIVNNEDVMPLIWVKHKASGRKYKYLIISFDEDNVWIADVGWKDMQDLFDDYKYLDGSPIGKKEE